MPTSTVNIYLKFNSSKTSFSYEIPLSKSVSYYIHLKQIFQDFRSYLYGTFKLWRLVFKQIVLFKTFVKQPCKDLVEMKDVVVFSKNQLI